MSLFPPTSLTLLHKLAVEVTGGNEAAWVRLPRPSVGSFCDVAADCSVYKGYHTERSYRRENCGLRLAARIRPTAAERADSAANR